MLNECTPHDRNEQSESPYLRSVSPSTEWYDICDCWRRRCFLETDSFEMWLKAVWPNLKSAGISCEEKTPCEEKNSANLRSKRISPAGFVRCNPSNSGRDGARWFTTLLFMRSRFRSTNLDPPRRLSGSYFIAARGRKHMCKYVHARWRPSWNNVERRVWFSCVHDNHPQSGKRAGLKGTAAG